MLHSRRLASRPQTAGADRGTLYSGSGKGSPLWARAAAGAHVQQQMPLPVVAPPELFHEPLTGHHLPVDSNPLPDIHLGADAGMVIIRVGRAPESIQQAQTITRQKTAAMRTQATIQGGVHWNHVGQTFRPPPGLSPYQVGRGVQAGAVAAVAEDALGGRAGRTLPLGARHVDDRQVPKMVLAQLHPLCTVGIAGRPTTAVPASNPIWPSPPGSCTWTRNEPPRACPPGPEPCP